MQQYNPVNYKRERVSQSLAKLKTHGHEFEIVIDPEQAVAYRHGKAEAVDAIKSEHIFSNALKGDFAKEHDLQEVFGTTNPVHIAEIILKEGSIQINDEYKEKLLTSKVEKLTARLLRDAVHEETNKPLSEEEIRSALDEAKVHIDIFKAIDSQYKEIVDKIRPVLHLSFDPKIIDIKMPSEYAAKLYGAITTKANKMIEENWMENGAFMCKIEISPGLLAELVDELKHKTHGKAEIVSEHKDGKKGGYTTKERV